MKPLYVVDEIETIVNSVNEEILTTIQDNETSVLGSTKIEKVSYHKGHYLELLETLSQRDTKNFKNLKYPLVYLQQDFSERRTDDGFYANVNLRIIIIHHTIQQYKAGERYTKVFKPVLYPIYYELLNQIALYPQVVESDDQMFRHTKTDRVFWGKGSIADKTEVTLNDFVDAIDIENLELKFYIRNC